MKSSAWIGISSAVLAVALVASGFMMFRAWRTTQPDDDTADTAPAAASDTTPAAGAARPAPLDRDAVLSHLDRVHAELAEKQTLRLLLQLPREMSTRGDLEHELVAVGRAARDAVQRDDEPLTVTLAAIPFHARVDGASDDLWLSSPLGGEDAGWIRTVVEGMAAKKTHGSTHVVENSRSRGVAFTTFVVAGERLRGGVFWMLPRRVRGR